MGKLGREGIGASESTYLWMGKSGRERIRAREQHLPRMGKLGRERIRVSEQHSPKDGQGREGIGAGKGTHQLESADRWAVRTGGKWSEREHSSMVLWMSKSGREGMGVSKRHSPTGKCRGTV